VETTDWWRQVRLSVRFIATRSNLIALSILHGSDVDADADTAIVLHHALIILLLHRQPKALAISVPFQWFVTLLSHVFVMVLLIH
jgi:hypothetical protein